VLNSETLFKASQNSAGHYQVIDLNTMEPETVKYWEPRFSVDTYHTEEYFICELGRLLHDTVTIQLRSDVPVGAYLSGGMDSSIVTLLASSSYPGRLKTFTGAFREGRITMNGLCQEVASHMRRGSFETYPTERDFIDLLPRLIYHMHEPAAALALSQYMVSRLASSHVKVVLGGQGGDEIFGAMPGTWSLTWNKR